MRTVAGLLDADVAIDILQRHPQALNWIRTQHYIGLPIVIRYELIKGAINKQELGRVYRLLDQFEIVPLEKEDQLWAEERLARYGLSHNIGIIDALAAAVAHRLEVPIYTRNLKHFRPMIGELAQKPYP